MSLFIKKHPLALALLAIVVGVMVATVAVASTGYYFFAEKTDPDTVTVSGDAFEVFDIVEASSLGLTTLDLDDSSVVHPVVFKEYGFQMKIKPVTDYSEIVVIGKISPLGGVDSGVANNVRIWSYDSDWTALKFVQAGTLLSGVVVDDMAGLSTSDNVLAWQEVLPGGTTTTIDFKIMFTEGTDYSIQLFAFVAADSY
jgi:hypothetical protein